MQAKKWFYLIPLLVLLALFSSLSGCIFSEASDWTRRDMPIDGMDRVVTYNLQGPANSGQEVNRASLRGVNENSPRLDQEVIFDRMPGSKTQDVKVTLPDGRVYLALGMVKTQRFAGLSNYMSLESCTYSGVDYKGKIVCGAKVRMQFNRNLLQYADSNKRDWDAIFYYDIPGTKVGDQVCLDLESATLRAVVINQVWQARIASGSFFFNWGHCVTAIGGPAARLKGGWWTHWDIPGSTEDAMGMYEVLNAMVLDLESSPHPWVEFSPNGNFQDAYLIYSAGDADQYLTWNRFFLNRQNEYAVLYRPDRQTPWDWVTVKPIYNVEWNDVSQNIAALRGLSPIDPMKDKLDESGQPKDPHDPVIKELETIGWMNAPNASLEQVQINDRNGKVLYCMTVRAFIGASDTLVMFGRATPPNLGDVRSQMGSIETQPMPMLYDEKGKPLGQESQPYTNDQWAYWLRESTMWNFLQDNPGAVHANTMVQYRFSDNTSWEPIYSYNGNNSYVCGYSPVEWNLSASYYVDGAAREPWLIMQLLGEVGVRTLGFSYCSGRFEGTGIDFALGQLVLNERFYQGYNQEDIWTLDARALITPDTLAEAWKVLHQQQ